MSIIQVFSYIGFLADCNVVYNMVKKLYTWLKVNLTSTKSKEPKTNYKRKYLKSNSLYARTDAIIKEKFYNYYNKPFKPKQGIMAYN